MNFFISHFDFVFVRIMICKLLKKVRILAILICFLPQNKVNCNFLSHNLDFVSCNFEKKSGLRDINSELQP